MIQYGLNHILNILDMTPLPEYKKCYTFFQCFPKKDILFNEFVRNPESTVQFLSRKILSVLTHWGGHWLRRTEK